MLLVASSMLCTRQNMSRSFERNAWHGDFAANIDQSDGRHVTQTVLRRAELRLARRQLLELLLQKLRLVQDLPSEITQLARNAMLTCLGAVADRVDVNLGGRILLVQLVLHRLEVLVLQLRQLQHINMTSSTNE